MDTEPAPTPMVIVEAERYCIRCGYLLRGLPVNGNCPECGTQVELSLREPTLAGASPEYLQKTLKGLSLILNAILLSVILMVVGFVIVAVGIAGTIGPAAPFSSPELMVGLTLLGVGISYMSLLGYWRFSEPDPAAVAFEPNDAARKVLRVFVLIDLVTTALSALVHFITTVGTAGGPTGGPDMTPLGMLMWTLTLVAYVVYAVKFFAMMRYTRWLASRVPDSFVVRRTKTFMWLLPVLTTFGAICVGLGPLIALVLYWNLLNRMRTHLKSIIATGRPADLPKMDVPKPTNP